jgi:hypothetical protein
VPVVFAKAAFAAGQLWFRSLGLVVVRHKTTFLLMGNCSESCVFGSHL